MNSVYAIWLLLSIRLQIVVCAFHRNFFNYYNHKVKKYCAIDTCCTYAAKHNIKYNRRINYKLWFFIVLSVCLPVRRFSPALVKSLSFAIEVRLELSTSNIRLMINQVYIYVLYNCVVLGTRSPQISRVLCCGIIFKWVKITV